MTALPQIATVPFHDHQILTAKDGDTVFVIMRPLVRTLGLVWQSQHERIRNHPALSQGVRFILTPSGGGEQEQLSLDLPRFHGWLVTLDTRRIEDEGIRATILRYQEESFQAIHDYWTKGSARNPRAENRRGYPSDTVVKMLDKLKRETNPAARRTIHAVLERACQELDIPTPALEDIGQDAPKPPEKLVPFFSGLEVLRNRGIRYNHALKPGFLALNLIELDNLFRENRIPVVIDSQMKAALMECKDPEFIDKNKSVCSAFMDRKTVKCWLFQWKAQ
jgi:hypothetical protein